MREIDWDAMERRHEWRVDKRFKDRLITLAELDLIVAEFDEGCADGQKRFLEHVQKLTMSPVEQSIWREEADARKYLAVWQQYKDTRDRFMVGVADRSRDQYVCRYEFEPRNDIADFCAYCGMMPEDHTWAKEYRGRTRG